MFTTLILPRLGLTLAHREIVPVAPTGPNETPSIGWVDAAMRWIQDWLKDGWDILQMQPSFGAFRGGPPRLASSLGIQRPLGGGRIGTLQVTTTVYVGGDSGTHLFAAGTLLARIYAIGGGGQGGSNGAALNGCGGGGGGAFGFDEITNPLGGYAYSAGTQANNTTWNGKTAGGAPNVGVSTTGGVGGVAFGAWLYSENGGAGGNGGAAGTEPTNGSPGGPAGTAQGGLNGGGGGCGGMAGFPKFGIGGRGGVANAVAGGINGSTGAPGGNYGCGGGGGGGGANAAGFPGGGAAGVIYIEAYALVA